LTILSFLYDISTYNFVVALAFIQKCHNFIGNVSYGS